MRKIDKIDAGKRIITENHGEAYTKNMKLNMEIVITNAPIELKLVQAIIPFKGFGSIGYTLDGNTKIHFNA